MNLNLFVVCQKEFEKIEEKSQILIKQRELIYIIQQATFQECKQGSTSTYYPPASALFKTLNVCVCSIFLLQYCKIDNFCSLSVSNTYTGTAQFPQFTRKFYHFIFNNKNFIEQVTQRIVYIIFLRKLMGICSSNI